MNPESANGTLLQRHGDVNFRQIQRVERRPVIFHFRNEIRTQGESDLDLVLPVVRESIAQQVREVLLQGEIGRLNDMIRQMMVARKLLERLDDLLIFARLIFKDDLQSGAGWRRKQA